MVLERLQLRRRHLTCRKSYTVRAQGAMGNDQGSGQREDSRSDPSPAGMASVNCGKAGGTQTSVVCSFISRFPFMWMSTCSLPWSGNSCHTCLIDKVLATSTWRPEFRSLRHACKPSARKGACRDRWIPGASWPVNLALCLSSSLNERACLKI